MIKTYRVAGLQVNRSGATHANASCLFAQVGQYVTCSSISIMVLQKISLYCVCEIHRNVIQENTTMGNVCRWPFRSRSVNTVWWCSNTIHASRVHTSSNSRSSRLYFIQTLQTPKQHRLALEGIPWALKWNNHWWWNREMNVTFERSHGPVAYPEEGGDFKRQERIEWWGSGSRWILCCVSAAFILLSIGFIL